MAGERLAGAAEQASMGLDAHCQSTCNSNRFEPHDHEREAALARAPHLSNSSAGPTRLKCRAILPSSEPKTAPEIEAGAANLVDRFSSGQAWGASAGSF